MPARTRESKIAQVQAEEQQQQKIEDAVLDAAAIRAQYGIPDYLTPIVCDLPKYRGLIACYDTSVPYGKTPEGIAYAGGKVKNDDELGTYRRFAALCPRIEEWRPLHSYMLDTDYKEAPSVHNLKAWEWTEASDHEALFRWLLGDGWQRALEVASGN